MKFIIDNVSKVNHADIDANGITVVAGYNNTGKTTILRSMDILLKSYTNIKENILAERKRSVRQVVRKQDLYFDKNGFEDLSIGVLYDIENLVVKEMKDEQSEKISFDTFHDLYINVIDNCGELDKGSELYDKAVSEEFARGLYKEIEKVFDRKDETYMNYIVELNIRKEFNNQAVNLKNYLESRITLENGDNKAEVVFSNNKLLSEYGSELGSSSVIYLETKNILDDLNNRPMQGGTNELMRMLKKEQVFDSREISFETYSETESNLQSLEDIFSEVIHGRLYNESGTVKFLEDNIEQPINIKNVASGMKIFLILQRLIANGSLSEHSWILIDEPETNMHPEWHLKFAETLILLKLKMDINVVVSSHSPYFIRALELKLADYGIKDLGSFYLMEEKDNSFFAKNVTESTDEIYKQLYKPLDMM